MIDRLISSDDHVIEPPNLWTSRAPKWAADRVPQVRVEGDDDRWWVDQQRTGSFAAGIQAGKRFEDPLNLRTAGKFEEVAPGAVDPMVHLEDNASDGILGSVLYPTLGLSLFRSIAEGALLDVVCQIYNDWLADFCKPTNGLLKGVAMINTDDPEAAVAEMTRTRELGLEGAFIPVAMPPERNYGLDMYDPVWAASQDLGMPISLHLGAVRSGAPGADQEFDTKVLTRTYFITIGDYCKATLADIIFAGVFERFPRLRVGTVEHELGWIPFFLDQMDYIYTQRQGNNLFHKFPDGNLPSDYFRSNVFCSFQEDALGIEHREQIGIDNLMFGSDYPHTESTFPRSREIMSDRLKSVPEDQQRLIVFENAKRLYNFDID